MRGCDAGMWWRRAWLWWKISSGCFCLQCLLGWREKAERPVMEERAEGRRESFLVVVSHLLFPKLYLSFLEVLRVLFKLCIVIPPPSPCLLIFRNGSLFSPHMSYVPLLYSPSRDSGGHRSQGLRHAVFPTDCLTFLQGDLLPSLPLAPSCSGFSSHLFLFYWGGDTGVRGGHWALEIPLASCASCNASKKGFSRLLV